MSAAFSPLPDKPTHSDLFERLCVISDISESLQMFANTILSKDPGNEGDGHFFLVHECAGRIYREVGELMGGIDTCKPKQGSST